MAKQVNHYSIQKSTGYWIQRIASSMSEHFREQLAQHGVARSTWPILSAIHNEEASTPMALSRFIGMDPSAVTRKLDQLEKAGLVVRTPNGSDRRSIKLTLTSKAKGLVAKLAACSMATNEKFLSNVPSADAKELVRIIKAMLKNAEGPVREL